VRGPTCVFWADLTPSSLQHWPAHELGPSSSSPGRAAAAAGAAPHGEAAGKGRMERMESHDELAETGDSTPFSANSSASHWSGVFETPRRQEEAESPVATGGDAISAHVTHL
jgi:hypothetical protein